MATLSEKAALGRAVFGHDVQTGETRVYAPATAASSNGYVSVDIGGQVVLIPTVGAVSPGQEVVIQVQDGHPVAIGARGWGDSIQDAVDGVAQHVWTDAEGLHITLSEGSVAGQNILIDSNSLDVRSGTTVFASFDSSGAWFPTSSFSRDGAEIYGTQYATFVDSNGMTLSTGGEVGDRQSWGFDVFSLYGAAQSAEFIRTYANTLGWFQITAGQSRTDEEPYELSELNGVTVRLTPSRLGGTGSLEVWSDGEQLLYANRVLDWEHYKDMGEGAGTHLVLPGNSLIESEAASIGHVSSTSVSATEVSARYLYSGGQLVRWADSPTDGGNATRSNAVLTGEVDATSTATAFTATVDGLSTLYDGVTVYLTNGVVTSAANWTLDVNGLGALPVYQSQAAESRTTTQFNKAYSAMFIYNSSRVEGGCWDYFYGYNTNDNTLAYNVRSNQVSGDMHNQLYRYQVVFTMQDGSLLAANTVNNSTGTSKALTTEPFDPYAPVYYYNATTNVAAGDSPGAAYMYTQYGSGFDLRRAFNAGSMLTAKKPVYVRCVPQSGGTVKLDGDDCITQELPDAEDGRVYLRLGTAYNTTSVTLEIDHPLYEYRNGSIREWDNTPYTEHLSNIEIDEICV